MSVMDESQVKEACGVLKGILDEIVEDLISLERRLSPVLRPVGVTEGEDDGIPEKRVELAELIYGFGYMANSIRGQLKSMLGRLEL